MPLPQIFIILLVCHIYLTYCYLHRGEQRAIVAGKRELRKFAPSRSWLHLCWPLLLKACSLSGWKRCADTAWGQTCEIFPTAPLIGPRASKLGHLLQLNKKTHQCAIHLWPTLLAESSKKFDLISLHRCMDLALYSVKIKSQVQSAVSLLPRETQMRGMRGSA